MSEFALHFNSLMCLLSPCTDHLFCSPWCRFLRRDRSIMADVAMGQVLSTTTCPECQFSSRSFDPFNLLSIPIPTVADVVFQCTVIRRATTFNCPWILNKPRKGEKRRSRFNFTFSAAGSSPPSEQFVAEQYVIAMSRLADSGDLRLQIQNICGIPAENLRLGRAEEVIMHPDADSNSVIMRQMKVIPLTDKEGPCSQLAKPKPFADDIVTAPTQIIAFETTLKGRPPEQNSEERTDSNGDSAEEEDEEDDPKHAPSAPSSAELRELEKQLDVYGDEKECRIYDTDPFLVAKAVSRSLWPRSENELKLGLRVDAIDHRGNWFPGSVVELVEGVQNPNEKPAPDDAVAMTKVRVHFDNFSTKWDELYTINHFREGKVRPLYSHSSRRAKPTEFFVHHRFTDNSTRLSNLFGQSFYVQCQNEWSTARAGAHILAQATRFLQRNSDWSGPIDLDDPGGIERDAKVQRLYERTHSSISDLIDLLVDCDREYVRLALGISEHNSEDQRAEPYRNPTFDATILSTALVKKVANLLHRLPFEVRVCTIESTQGNKPGAANEEVNYPFSLMRTIGNYMNARHAVVLQWKEPPSDKKSGSPTNYLNAPVMYVEPNVAIDRTSAEILKSNEEARKKVAGSRPGSGGLSLGVCLSEFCKVQQLSIVNDNWRCPRCKDFREGKQNLDLWKLPDLLTFHIKRFNCSARWREKISTKVNFPLTGLDMSEWCHAESPALGHQEESNIYDLIGVMNHYGSMTGGHYVAVCKATACGKDGREEVAYNFNGAGASSLEVEEDAEAPTGWRIGRQKAEAVNQNKVAAGVSAKAVAESAEPLWLQFDDDLVEPVPPRYVVSEMAYVLFYRRRRLTPSNIAKYSTLE
jgi:rubredoxin